RLTQLLMGVLILAFLFMLRPSLLGGAASYVTVQQNDLEPLLYEGDLAVVRQQAEYQLGELVAVETLEGPYFGRILGQERELFQVRFAAGEEPVAVSREYVLGRIWFNIGEIGRRLSGSVLEAFKISA
ncbi:MAG: hypothetical protein ACC700_17925, partial [Anaerolineales bacterium]